MSANLALKSASAMNPFNVKWPAAPHSSAASSGNPVMAWPDYMVDALQRSVLFLDLLRQRGNEENEITSRPMATVLRFDHEELMSGRSLPRPINYSLLRILPLPGVAIDRRKRPVVVVDPRAGQGPGIGGFKADSEIGDALNAGHPVYFIGFSAMPVPGQQFLDVVEGQVKFFERVVELHPDAPRPFAIGNCQAGYQTLMVAMLRPDLFGPCLVAGSPMSYWQGVHGKNPMRYSGGLLGGSWLTAMTSDLGNGKFDGTGLILNFDVLNPANWLWGKQYEVYTHIDTDAERYLKFEKWWGDFIQLNGDELQFLVDNLFIGDKLTRNQLHSQDGTTFDLRNITSPIIVFTSSGDNISPPPQALGWIIDLYRDVDDIRATGRTIVYSLNHEIGHLGLFVSAKVGAKEDEDFVQDRTDDGRAYRTLNIIDEFTREALMIRVARKLNSTDVVDALTDLFILRGPPAFIRSDNGPEFIAQNVRDWIAAVGAKAAYIEPGSPWENGYCESFNARFRDERLNGEVFYTLKEARIVIEQWRKHYNTVRPHSALGYRPPAPESFVPMDQLPTMH